MGPRRLERTKGAVRERTAGRARAPGFDTSPPGGRTRSEPLIEVNGLSIRTPMKLRRRGGRKLVIAPDGLAGYETRPTFDDVLINALLRANRWRRQIDTGEFRSASELAAHENITDSYVARMLTLTLLAPDITQAILEGRQPKELKLATLLRGIPLGWEEQRRAFGLCLASR